MKHQNPRDVLRSVGLKATTSRMHILKVFQEETLPLDVAYLKQLVVPPIHEATLHRMMQSFLEKGIIRQVNLGKRATFYEFVQKDHHHHIICSQCGYIEDISSCFVQKSLEQDILSATSFARITEHSFEVFGICEKCKGV